MNRILLQNIHTFGGVLILRLMSAFFFFALSFVSQLDAGIFWKIKRITLRIDVHYTACAPKEAGKSG